ncbi:MAG: hypothetical protein ACFE85_07390 [Candidatus Hodarchaeota archaeon]
MEDDQFLALSSLFETIGVIEKGIEKIYHYLLLNKRIENLKDVSSKFNLTLKRGYKICSVLNELELVQIYDRPMKIHLSTPVIPLWQKIINNRIEELSQQFQEKKMKAETNLDDFVKQYGLDQQVTQEYVEFIKYNLKNLDETYQCFLATNECKIAIGIRYENELISLLKNVGASNISQELKELMTNGMVKIKENLKKLNIEAIFNSELMKEILKSEEFNLLSDHVEKYDLEFKSINLHVTDEDFSNFSLTNDALIQPSFDPTNKLIGYYISRNKSIYQIFYDKFNEIFERGISISDFLKENKNLKLNSLSDSQSFILCLM